MKLDLNTEITFSSKNIEELIREYIKVNYPNYKVASFDFKGFNRTDYRGDSLGYCFQGVTVKLEPVN